MSRIERRRSDPVVPRGEPRPTARRWRAVWFLVPVLACCLAATARPHPTPREGTPGAAGPETAETSATDRPSPEEGAGASRHGLPEAYERWLEEVEPLITRPELRVFLNVRRDYHREAFIDRFWRERDPYPETGRNELKENWTLRVAQARALFGDLEDDRSRTLLLNGRPDGRCRDLRSARELWYYAGSDRLREPFNLLFVRPQGQERYRLWVPGSEVGGSLGAAAQPGSAPVKLCPGEIVDRFLRGVAAGSADYVGNARRSQTPPEPPSVEWVLTFETYSTDLPPVAVLFPAELELDFPGRFQSRTVVQALLGVPAERVVADAEGERGVYHFLLTGEVVLDGRLFENFRYRFDIPRQLLDGDRIPLVFQRHLRPGEYLLVLKLEDLEGETFHRVERPIEVPRVEGDEPPEPLAEASRRLLAEARAAVARGERDLEIVPPPRELVTGLARFDVRVLGSDFDRLTFYLDGREVVSRLKPPYGVEIDLGPLPRVRALRVEALDGEGREVAADEILVNANSHRFDVRLAEPRTGRTYRRSLRADARVRVPEGRVVERVELFLDETLVAVLYQPPFVQPMVLPEEGAVAYVRAVAYLPDGASAEDVVFVNAPDLSEEIDIDLVELYTSVLDRSGRPVEGLERGDFRVEEDGRRQELLRFERVRDLPFHAAVLIDSSASMGPRIGRVKQAAMEFLQQTITSRDRAAVIPFHDQPEVAVPFTRDLDELARGLVGVRAERGTALYDSIVFGLYYFNGIQGQRALLVLSDGKDEHSRFSFEECLKFAQRAGVTIYAVGLDLGAGSLKARRQLSELAEETGGRSFFVRDVDELSAIYSDIQRELRSQYLLAYQSDAAAGSEEFRQVEVEVVGSGAEAKTIRGYYP